MYSMVQYTVYRIPYTDTPSMTGYAYITTTIARLWLILLLTIIDHY